jgi:cytochrome c oxidase assembly protein subunit 15
MTAKLDDWRLALPEAKRRRVRIWLWTIAAFTLLVLVIGGTTRLTESGLSIVDWQPIIGVVPPLNDAAWQEAFERYRQYPQFQQVRNDMTLAEFKVIFFWEYLHRLAARAIGVVFLLPFLFFAARGYFNRPIARRALALFALGALQGVIGWLMVKSGLVDRPSVSHYRLATHLALAFLIMGYSVWLARELAIGPIRERIDPGSRRTLGRSLATVGALLAVQIVWGAFVAGLDAGRVYNTFPLMGGSLVPPDLLWLRPAVLNFVQNPIAVQWMHRVLGTLLLAATFVVFLHVRRRGTDASTRRLSLALLALIVVQYLLGIWTLIAYVPVTLGVIHQAMAMVIAGLWVCWLHHVHNLAIASPDGPVA